MHALPIGERRTGNDNWAEQVGPQCSEHHHCPARLTVSDHARLTIGLWVQFKNFLKEYAFGARNILDGLSRHRLWQKADEVAGVTRFQFDADLAVGLEAADARAVARARVDDDKRP